MVEANLLTSNYQTGELGFHDFDRPETEWSVGYVLIAVIALLAWPLIFLAGCWMAIGLKIKDLSWWWDQRILKAVQKDDARLFEYGEKKFESHKRKYTNILQKAMHLVSEMQRQDPTFPQLSTQDLKTFPGTFLNLDLSQVREDEETFSKFKGENLFTLKRYQLKLRCLAYELTQNSEENQLERFRLIAQIASNKKEFRRLEAKEWIHRAVLCLIPLGILYSLDIYPNDRACISQALIDKHNQLVQNNHYLLPYWPGR